MPFPKPSEPTGAYGAADFFYGRGFVPYPTAHVARTVDSPSLGVLTGISEVVGVNVTHSFTVASGSTPQASPESKIIIDTPAKALLVYVGHFWYDVSNTGTVEAKVFHRTTLNGHEIGSSRGLLHQIAPGKDFEIVTDDEIFFLRFVEFALVDPGRYEIQHEVWVDNASSLSATLQFKYSDRSFMGYAQFATEVGI